MVAIFIIIPILRQMLIKRVVIVVHLRSGLGVLLQRPLIIMADAFPICAFFGQLHPLNLINCLRGLIFCNWTIMVANY